MKLTIKGWVSLHITLISTVYVSPGCTPYSVTLVLLTVIGDCELELTLCVMINKKFFFNMGLT